MTRWEAFWITVGFYVAAIRQYTRHFFGWFVCKWKGCYWKMSATHCRRCGKKAWFHG